MQKVWSLSESFSRPRASSSIIARSTSGPFRLGALCEVPGVSVSCALCEVPGVSGVVLCTSGRLRVVVDTSGRRGKLGEL